MLEEMRKSRTSRRIILAPDIIPDLNGHARGGRIGQGVDPEPVLKLAEGRLERRDGHALDIGASACRLAGGQRHAGGQGRSGAEQKAANFGSEAGHGRVLPLV